jgi:hypothetical protein
MYKYFIHVNGLILMNFPNYSLPDYLGPSQLYVRIPSTEAAWDRSADDFAPSTDDTLTVGDLFSGSHHSRSYASFSSLAAWDFTTGMFISVFYNREDNASPLDYMKRIAPFLFWHMKTGIGRGVPSVGSDTTAPSNSLFRQENFTS